MQVQNEKNDEEVVKNDSKKMKKMKGSNKRSMKLVGVDKDGYYVDLMECDVELLIEVFVTFASNDHRRLNVVFSISWLLTPHFQIYLLPITSAPLQPLKVLMIILHYNFEWKVSR